MNFETLGSLKGIKFIKKYARVVFFTAHVPITHYSS